RPVLQVEHRLDHTPVLIVQRLNELIDSDLVVYLVDDLTGPRGPASPPGAASGARRSPARVADIVALHPGRRALVVATGELAGLGLATLALVFHRVEELIDRAHLPHRQLLVVVLLAISLGEVLASGHLAARNHRRHIGLRTALRPDAPD